MLEIDNISSSNSNTLFVSVLINFWNVGRDFPIAEFSSVVKMITFGILSPILKKLPAKSGGIKGQLINLVESGKDAIKVQEKKQGSTQRFFG